MGMTDKQFEAYLQRLQRELERAEAEMKEQGTMNILHQLMADINNHLKKP